MSALGILHITYGNLALILVTLRAVTAIIILYLSLVNEIINIWMSVNKSTNLRLKKERVLARVDQSSEYRISSRAIFLSKHSATWRLLQNIVFRQHALLNSPTSKSCPIRRFDFSKIAKRRQRCYQVFLAQYMAFLEIRLDKSFLFELQPSRTFCSRTSSTTSSRVQFTGSPPRRQIRRGDPPVPAYSEGWRYHHRKLKALQLLVNSLPLFLLEHFQIY